MSTARILKLTAIAALLMITAAAYASDTVRLQTATFVSGQKLPAGEYSVNVNGTGPVADVSFLHGKKVVATAKAQVKELSTKADHDTILVDTSNGTRNLSEIQWSGKTRALVFEKGDQMSAGDTSGAGKQ